MGKKRKGCLRVEIPVGLIDLPAFEGLTIAAVRIFLRAFDYCRVHGSDGLIPTSSVGLIAAKTSAKRLVQTLVSNGLFEEVEGGYYVPLYLEHNRPHEQVLAQSKRRSERGRRHRQGDPCNGVPNGPDVVSSGGGETTSLSPPPEGEPKREASPPPALEGRAPTPRLEDVLRCKLQALDMPTLEVRKALRRPLEHVELAIGDARRRLEAGEGKAAARAAVWDRLQEVPA